MGIALTLRLAFGGHSAFILRTRQRSACVSVTAKRDKTPHAFPARGWFRPSIPRPGAGAGTPARSVMRDPEMTTPSTRAAILEPLTFRVLACETD